MYSARKTQGSEKRVKIDKEGNCRATWNQFSDLFSLGMWNHEPSQEKVAQPENILKVAKVYFTQIEIIRLYNSLSNKGKEKVVLYAHNLSQEE